MNAARLLAHYEHVADAPDAIARLRRFILDLAVRGKLLPHDTNDEPASELLKRIAKEKARLVKAGELRTPNAIPALPENPFPIPSNWRWSQLAEIGVLSPRNEAPDTREASFVPMPLIAAEYGVANQHEIRPWGEIKKGYTHFAEGDVGLAKITPCFENGKSAVFRNLTGGIGAGTTELHVVRLLFVDRDYVLLFLKSPHFIETGIPKMTGTAGQKRVPTEYFAHSPFPLPPLAEQHRIVGKVDELMGLCDRLETARAAREAARDRLTASSLVGLRALEAASPPAAASSPSSNVIFQTTATAATASLAKNSIAYHARFVLEALPALTARPDQINALRQTILNLAVRGKLVQQDAKDEPASELLKQIAKKRAELLKAGYPNPDEARTQIKKLAEQSVPNGLETLPKGWAWATLLQCSALVIDCKNKTAPYASAGIRLIRTTNVRNGQMNGNDQKYVDQKTYEVWSARCTPERGDILITREAPMGEVCLIPPGEQICLGQRMMLSRLVPNTIDSNFMIYSLRDPRLMDRVQDKPIGATVQHLRVGGVETLLVPLPPLAEQHRIVAKVDALMTLCDRLEASLTATAATRRRLLDALLAEALEPDVAHSGAEAGSIGSDLTAKIPVSYEERSAFVLAFAFDRHRSANRDRTFGHVKAQKILHLVEAETNLDLGRKPIKDAAGPNDFPHLLATGKWAQSHQYFVFEKIGNGYTFRPLAKFGELKAKDLIDPNVRTRIAQIVDLFVPMDMQASEVFATVYAAWNNLLIEGKDVTDENIVRAAREEWHPNKSSISRDLFFKSLRHLRATKFVPTGKGKIVAEAQQQTLFK